MILAILIAAAILAVALFAYYAYRVAFYVPAKREENIYDLPMGEEYVAHHDKMHECIRTLDSLPYESVTITAFDGKKLFGRYYHTRDGAPLQIQFHGYRGSAMRDFCGGTPLAQKMGCNALVVDQRAHGRSEGRTITFGVLERYDCQSWCRYAYDRFGENTPIILSGVSMGAATVLMASDLPLPETVCCVIADCPFSSPEAIITRVAGGMGLPKKAAAAVSSIGAFLYGGFRLGSACAVKSVQHTHLPILLIHGEGDNFVPCSMSEEIRDACASEVTLELFPKAGHAMCYMEDTNRYEAVVATFLNQHLPQ